MRETLNFLEKVIGRFDKLSKDELNRILNQLQKEYEKYSLILDNLKEGIVALNKKYEINEFNIQAAYMLKLSPSSKGEHILNAVGNGRFNDVIKNLMEEENLTEEIIIADEENKKIVSLTFLPLGQKGVIKGFLLKLSDITESMRKEEQLKRAEQLASLTTLAAGVAHDIKNPLGSLDIYIQLIKKVTNNLPKESKEKHEIEEYINIVKEEIGRLEDTVNSFLFSVKKIQLNTKKLDIKNLIEETLKFLQYEIKKNNVDVHVFKDESIPEIEGDERYLKQALINLIQNSIDAVKDSEKKDIEIKSYREEKSEYISLIIKDSGKGIAQEKIKKIFEPYYTTKKFGTGLGLTNVYRIIDAHAGQVDIQSEENEGTEITIRLPFTLSKRKLLKQGE